MNGRFTIFSKKDNAYLSAENIVNCKPIRPEIQKLGQYEDNDEKLGIDYNTLFKALKDGIYVVEKGMIEFAKSDDIWITKKSIMVHFPYQHLYSDYGKTWALTKEELL